MNNEYDTDTVIAISMGLLNRSHVLFSQVSIDVKSKI